VQQRLNFVAAGWIDGLSLTLIEASKSISTAVSRKTFSLQCSWSSGASRSRARIISTTVGNSSRSSETCSAMSSASARVSAMQAASGSPT
jgi:hypothetical protein